jgi:hypothetical protein
MSSSFGTDRAGRLDSTTLIAERLKFCRRRKLLPPRQIAEPSVEEVGQEAFCLR